LRTLKMDKLEATGLLKRYQGEDKEGYNYCNNPYSSYYGELNCMIPLLEEAEQENKHETQ
jgi:hypothetical protein